jgi:hypothetical protein
MSNMPRHAKRIRTCDTLYKRIKALYGDDDGASGSLLAWRQP